MTLTYFGPVSVMLLRHAEPRGFFRLFGGGKGLIPVSQPETELPALPGIQIVA